MIPHYYRRLTRDNSIAVSVLGRSVNPLCSTVLKCHSALGHLIAVNLISRAGWKEHCITGASCSRGWRLKIPSSKTSSKTVYTVEPPARHSWPVCELRQKKKLDLRVSSRIYGTYARICLGGYYEEYLRAGILLSQRIIH